MSFTASKTTFVMQAGAINVSATALSIATCTHADMLGQVTVAFLSPVTPRDLVRQTLPYSYMEVSVTPNDAATHSVQLYTDITGEWASNDWARNITWGKTVLNSTLHVHQIQLLNQTLYGEVQDSTTYGSVVYATDMVRVKD